jgi:hypothetical protein
MAINCILWHPKFNCRRSDKQKSKSVKIQCSTLLKSYLRIFTKSETKLNYFLISF